ncbi:hypothetical protein GCM10017691_24170 [Pseudonocardia petroleophila]|uniref:Uncharacterized protein n=1 Tax=Pseudonocardia petroleophila TaxID=37331 RepID=A0A7G7MFS8_9PSEU|nr:hypothetical protein [Pseudonocardia petroleophila]QNG51639.1 hypothetical protein H6H00_26625 [Pseudonocardia petroleophila]
MPTSDGDLTQRQQQVLQHVTDGLVDDIYFEFAQARAREEFLDHLVERLDPAEVDRAIEMIFQAA